MKRKLGVIFAICTLSISLSGCRAMNRVNRLLEDQIKQQSGVYDDENYIKYEGYQNEGKVNGDGYYQPEESQDVRSKNGIHISFATNNNLSVVYYSDKEHKTMIDTNAYYADPGTDIYADVSVSDDINSSEYGLSGFRIVEYDNKGGRKEREDLKSDFLTSGLVLHVPENYNGYGLSVEPIGHYQNRIIRFEDYYVDDDGSKHALNGEWAINDKSVKNDSAEISPVSPYIVSYKYDKENFFYLASSPACFYNDFALGEVIFKQREAADETVDYSVELHRFISVGLISNQDRTVSVNGKSEQRIKANTELQIPQLKYGDSVIILTDKEWSDLQKCRDLILIDSEKISNNEFKYTMTVPQKGGEFEFNPADYKYEHGTIAFSCFGSKVTNTQFLAKGSKIYYEQETVDSGYWLPDGDRYIVVSNKEDTVRQLKAIRFLPLVKATVSLPQPECGGRIIYKINGSRITSKSYQVSSGTKIQMDFKAWEGWKNNYKNGEVYTVGSEQSQTVTIAGKSIDNAFTEDDDHKPKLDLVLEKSVGGNMKFTVEASGFKSGTFSYEEDKKIKDIPAGKYNIDQSQNIISDQKIGTEKGIYISMSNRAIPTGKAVRIAIDRTDTKGNKMSEIRYENDMSKKLDRINIYESDEIATSSTWYKEIKITIGVVDVRKYTVAKGSNHTVLTVRNADTKQILKQDELVEGSQNVIVTITPTPGYYVTGRRVTNGIYQDKMKYDEYVKKKTELINAHPAEKLIHVTLGTADKYAEYTYKLEGKVVSGSVNAEEGQQLKLNYDVSGTDYKVKKKLGDSIRNESAERSITITRDMDEKTIDRSDFNIEVTKGE